MSRIATFLWFHDQAREAAEFYTSLIENSRITDISHGPDGSVLAAAFELDGQRYVALNGGPHYTLTPAASIYVDCETQDQVDDLWAKLTDGGEESRCGWLIDRYGLSWQIIPTILPTLLSDPDPQRATRATTAMLAMSKIDIKSLLDAVNQP
jgi:predicted 3-demethylubiquinone-9 3-methyltransferase (glyoxalase superfamily)